MKFIPDLLIVIGACGLSYGSWLIHQPSGFIVAGILLMIAGIKTAE